MKTVANAARALATLFLGEGTLAAKVLLLLACTALIARLSVSTAWTLMTLLVGGSVLLLAEDVLRAARGPRQPSGMRKRAAGSPNTM